MNTTDNFRFSILAGAITLRAGNEVLLLQRSTRETFMPGAWGLPCGKIEYGEELQDAALRELKEESGIVGRVDRLVGYSTFFSTKDGVRVHNLQVNFAVTALTGDVQLEPSMQDYRWLPLAAVPDSHLDDFTKSAIFQLSARAE